VNFPPLVPLLKSHWDMGQNRFGGAQFRSILECECGWDHHGYDRASIYHACILRYDQGSRVERLGVVSPSSLRPNIIPREAIYTGASSHA
jgi:hypothetical protein